ncbi:MAG TPA: FtsX-like permease family protein [Anaerolineae bacterium]|nr:FtsX-like permease family protein [Anaerolineae bacterium]
MNIQLTLAARYLLGRKLRTFLTTLAVVFGVMILFGLNGLLPAMMDLLRLNIMASAGKVDLVVSGATDGAFDAGVADEVRAVEGVAHATGSLRLNATLPAGYAVPAITVVGIDPATAPEVRPYTLASGRYLQPGDGNVMVISENLSEQTGLKIGDTFSLPSASGATGFEIVGLIATRAMPGVEEVYVPLTAAQTMFNHMGRANTVEAIFSPGADRDRVESDVQARLGDEFKIGGIEAGGQFLASLEIGTVALNVFGILALTMGGFVIFNTFRTIVAERRRDIGMLRAVGASRKTVVGIILAESLLQGVIGTAVGMIVGAALAHGLRALASPFIEQFLHLGLGEPVFAVPTFLFALVMGVGISVLSGLLPAIQASRVTPLEALRPAVGEVAQRAAGRSAKIGAGLIALAALTLVSGNPRASAAGAFLVLIGLVLVGPALVRPIAAMFGRLLAIAFAREGQIAQGNLIRQPGRAAITASAMMIGMALIIAFAGLLSSFEDGFMRFLDKSMGADFLLIPQSIVLAGGNVGAGADLAQAIHDTPGVETVTTLRVAQSQALGTPLQVIGIDPATYPQVVGLEFVSSIHEQAYAEIGAGRAIILNGIFTGRNNVQPGDTITLETPEGPRDYRVVAIGTDYLNAKAATGFISQANLAADFNETSDVLLMANKASGADAASVRAALDRVVERYPAFTLFETTEWRASQTGTFASVIGALYFLMVALALPSLIALINTLAINVIERTREIGMIRAVGSTRRQVRRMILAESLLLAGLGIAFGILAGLWMGYSLVGAMGLVGFNLTYFFPAASVLVAIAVGLIFGVLAALIPARQAAKLDIVTALHYE